MKQSGFSLVELMVVVAILGIISAIAYPSYLKHVQSGHRLDAQRIMLEQSHLLERSYSRNGEYPATYSISSSRTYDFSYQRDEANADAYVMTATPKATGTSCGKLTLNQQGLKTAEGGTTCWAD